MVTGILTARGLHGVRDLGKYRQLHKAKLAKMRQRGVPIREHAASDPLIARVNHGVWIGDCACRSGVGVTPEWEEARCFGCGAVYTRLVVPKERVAIEAVLLERPNQQNRNWEPGESLSSLVADNIAHGIESEEGRR